MYDQIFSTMKAMEAKVASKGITDPSKVTAIVMLAGAYRKVRDVLTSAAAICCREMVFFFKVPAVRL